LAYGITEEIADAEFVEAAVDLVFKRGRIAAVQFVD
jgi:hypothetical protein